MKSIKKNKNQMIIINNLIKMIDNKIQIRKLNKLGLDSKEIWLIIMRMFIIKMKIIIAIINQIM